MDKASPRQIRQLDFISQFTTKILLVSGIDNTTADTLSRIAEIDRIYYADIAETQKNCPELQKLLKCSDTSLQLKLIEIRNINASL